MMNSALDNNTASFTMNKVWPGRGQRLQHPSRRDFGESAPEWKRLFHCETGYHACDLDLYLEKLPELDNNGVKYVYTVAEIPVPGYTASVEGGTITNQLGRP